MKPFLETVASDLFHKIGTDLSHTAVVFPNKRAGLFFNEYLARQSSRPVWSPTYLTINELFTTYPLEQPLTLADPITLVCRLYQVFILQTGRNESLDDFYFWGELLISDFDDLDKNLVDASRLFSNLQELHALSQDNSFLSPEQQEAISQFFSNFSPERRTLLKERFISLWERMLPIYTQFKQRLSQEGLAYEGMLERQVMEQFDVSKMPYDRYVFVGFNVLNRVEQQLFSALHRAEKALFYWDYDPHYTTLSAQHEAGEFILRNLKAFPNQLDESYFHCMEQPKQIDFIESPTENAQARYLTRWVRSLYATRAEHPFAEKENAVVLCNESLLLPVLHAIPNEVENVNITMGYPLAQTPVFSLLNALCTLQIDGYRPDSGTYLYEAVRPVLNHPYVRQLSPAAERLERELTARNRFFPLPSELQADDALKQLFTPVSGIAATCNYLIAALRLVSTLYRQSDGHEQLYDQLYREAIFKSYTLVNRLYALAQEQAFGRVNPLTFRRLLNRLLNGATIPFHGEPAIGMQVMGVLETRNLDFRNLLMLSVNEGKLPQHEGDASFVPYNLRKAFGMTTIDHKNCVYAYYFYRLLQRAERITLCYNSSSEGLNRGEMSRFMLQLLVESPHPIRRYTLQAGQAPGQRPRICIDKTPELVHLLMERYNADLPGHTLLSPTALNHYLDCRLKFYFRFVARIKPAPEVSTEIDSITFGNIFHRAAELIYLDLTAHGKMVQTSDLEQLLSNPQRIEQYVDHAFKELFFQVAPTEKPAYNGLQLINREVIGGYLHQLLTHDLHYAPFSMEGMETPVSETVTVLTPQGPLRLTLGGKVDRMDLKEGTLRIIDYKTGGSPSNVRSLQHLFTPIKDRPGYALQAFLYSSLLAHRHPSYRVSPALLYIHRAASDDYSPTIVMGERSTLAPVEDFRPLDEEFRNQLQELLEELFTPGIPFDQTDDDTRCTFCEFASLCHR